MEKVKPQAVLGQFNKRMSFQARVQAQTACSIPVWIQIRDQLWVYVGRRVLDRVRWPVELCVGIEKGYGKGPRNGNSKLNSKSN